MAVWRDAKTTAPPGYAIKFEHFIRLCQDVKSKGMKVVVISTPSGIGDTYEKIIESLSRLARADLTLAIAKPE